MSAEPLLSVEGVSVDLPTRRGALRAVESVDLTLMPGRTLGIVGESGSGKTMLSRAILGLLPRHARLAINLLFCENPVRSLGQVPGHSDHGLLMILGAPDPLIQP